MRKETNISKENTRDLVALCLLQQSKVIRDNQQTITQQSTYIKTLEEIIAALKIDQYGKKSERDTDDSQLDRVFNEADEPSAQEEESVEAAEESITVPEHQRKKGQAKAKRGRKPLPKHLPRIKKIHDLSHDDKQCACGCTLTCIGEEVTEQLDFVPATIQVIAHHHLKYACKGCEDTLKQAKHPAQPIPKSIATAGLLANILVAKFVDHLPLYRQEKQFQRVGVDIPRSTLSHWVIKSSRLLEPLYERLKAQLIEYDVAYADETTVQVLNEAGRTAQAKSYMWLFGGGSPERFSLCYHYAPGRGHEVAEGYLGEFSGYLHCDGYGGYDALAKKKKIQQVGCWFHVRRKFVDAKKLSSKDGLAQYVINQIKKLSTLEREIKTLSPEQRMRRRCNKAKPLIEKLKSWLIQQQKQVLPKSSLGKAISYTLNQWHKLVTYLDDGRLEMSNNKMERQMKPFATGRKNWLFAQSTAGAKAAAIIYSLIETAKQHGHEPQKYLIQALSMLPQTKSAQGIEALLPWNLDPT